MSVDDKEARKAALAKMLAAKNRISGASPGGAQVKDGVKPKGGMSALKALAKGRDPDRGVPKASKGRDPDRR